METLSLNLAEELLEKYDIKYENMTPAELETYNSKYFNLKRLTVSDLKEYISRMKNAVALELCDTPVGDPKDAVLKARLKNYILQELFLVAPDRAEKALRKQLDAKKRQGKLS